MSELTVLVIGSGGREHALAWALSRDPGVRAVHCAPGNPGTSRVGTNHPLDPMDGAAVASLARSLASDLVVIGPEAPLVAGVADHVREAGIPVFGPSGAAAMLEGSKAFAKEIMEAAEQKVHLFLFVKVRENWADDPERYREMGLEYPHQK